MKVLALTPSLYNTSPGLRFRVEQWAPYLTREDIHFSFVPFEDESLHRLLYQPGAYASKATLLLRALARRWSLLSQVRDFDVIFLYREASLIGPALIERLLSRTGRPIVYDFDDPIWLPYQSPTNGVFSRLKCVEKTASICRLAATVTVGNRLLAGWAARHARDVHVVPSTIEMANYPARPPDYPTSTIPTLGWTGSHSTLPFLKSLENALQRLAGRRRFRLLVISHTDKPELGWTPTFEVVARKWNAATEAVDLHAMDVGIAPFPDSGWTPWRCHGKVLQYMAVGIPTVASRMGILPDYVRDGQDGYLATSDDEWVERLCQLLDDAALRRRMGASARQRIAEQYSAHIWAPRLAAILKAAQSGCRN